MTRAQDDAGIVAALATFLDALLAPSRGMPMEEAREGAFDARAALFAAIDAYATTRAQEAARLVASSAHGALAAKALGDMDIARGVAHLTEALRMQKDPSP